MIASSKSRPLKSETAAPAPSSQIVSVQAPPRRRWSGWARSSRKAPMRLPRMWANSMTGSGRTRPRSSSRGAWAGVAPETSRTTPPRMASAAAAGGTSGAARRARFVAGPATARPNRAASTPASRRQPMKNGRR